VLLDEGSVNVAVPVSAKSRDREIDDVEVVNVVLPETETDDSPPKLLAALYTTVPAVVNVLPNVFAAANVMLPADKVNAPENVLEPLNTVEPAPLLEDVPEIESGTDTVDVPDADVALRVVAVKMPDPVTPLEVPDRVRVVVVWFAVPSARVPLPETVMLPEVESPLLPAEMSMVPEDTVVKPVKDIADSKNKVLLPEYVTPVVLPEELTISAAIEMLAVPLNVTVLFPAPVAVKGEVKDRVPDPLFVIVAPPVVPARLITRSVDCVPPV
jgi:hypothetical protein